MRNMLCVLAIALVPTPMFAVAGDIIHHGHDMNSSWDTQTGDGPQGSEWVTAPPPIHDFHYGRYYDRGHYGYQDYYPARLGSAAVPGCGLNGEHKVRPYKHPKILCVFSAFV